MTDLVITIQGTPGEAWQADAAIARVDADWYFRDPAHGPALKMTYVGRLLRKASEQSARDLGEVLHHAEWTITGDASTVRRLALAGDHAKCRQCRDGTAAALDYLAGGEGREVAVGRMWWRVNP